MAVGTGAVEVFVDGGNNVRRHFASTEDRLEVSFVLVVEAFVNLGCLYVDLPQTPEHRSVVAMLCLCSGPGSSLYQELLQGLNRCVDDVDRRFFVLPNTELIIDLQTIPRDRCHHQPDGPLGIGSGVMFVRSKVLSSTRAWCWIALLHRRVVTAMIPSWRTIVSMSVSAEIVLEKVDAFFSFGNGASYLHDSSNEDLRVGV